MKIMALIQLTFRESLAKKTFMAFLGISTFINLLLLFALNLDIVDGAKAYINVFGQQQRDIVSIKELVAAIEGGIAAALYSAGLLLALFATSSLIPSMLQKGSIDLLISKPLSRNQILMSRFLGASAIVAFNIMYLVLGTWLILSIKTGYWNLGFLLSGVLIIVTFMILYTMMAFFGVLTSSGPFSLMITFLIIVSSPLLIARDKIYALLSNKIYGYIIDGLYYFLPKSGELGDMTQKLVRGVEISSWFPLWSSIFFGFFVFWLTSLLFSKKNF
jgi:ABC-type transport system involved in multi-copper enzyme maturation permease subunit